MKKSIWIGGVVAAVLALATGSASAADTIINSTDNARTGAVVIGSGSGDNLYVGRNGGTGVLDVTGTDSFTVNVATFGLGITTSGNGSNGTVNLGPSNTITATTAVLLASAPSGGSITQRANMTTATGSTTTIYTPSMIIGVEKDSIGSFTLGSGATLSLEGLSGGRTSLEIAKYSSASDWQNAGTMNLSGGAANLILSNLRIARKTSSTHSPSVTGTLTLGTSASNHLDIRGAGNVVVVGSLAASGTISGTLTIGNLNATSSITSTDDSTAILLGTRTGASGTSTGTFNFNGGTLKITTAGAAIAGGGGGTSRLYLDGGAKLVAGANSSNWIHSLNTAEIKAGGATVDTAGFDIGISQAFTGAGGLIKDGAGILTLSGTQGYTGGTEVKAGTLNVTGSLSATGGLVVQTGATVTGTGTINSSLTFNENSKLDLTGAIVGLTSSGILTVADDQWITLDNFALSGITGWDWLNAGVGTYTLINGGGGVILSGTTPTESSPYAFGNGKSGYFQDGSLQLVVIPEPATLSMIGVIGIAMLLRRRIVRG